MKSHGTKKKKMVEIDPEELERQRKEAAYQAELKKYGRTWVWEGYYEDTDVNRAFWLEGAHRLRSINEQVI